MNLVGLSDNVQPQNLGWRLAAVRGLGMLLVLFSYPVLTHGLGRTVTVENKLFVALIELAFVIISVLVSGTRKWVWPSAISKRTGTILIVLLFAMALSTALSVQPAASVVRTAEWIVHLLFALSVFNVFRRDPALLGLVPAVVGLAFLLYFLTFLSEYVLSRGDPLFEWHKYTPGFTHIRHLGFFLVFVVPLSAYYWLEGARSSRLLRALSLLVACLAWMLVFEIGGRGPVFAIGVSLVIMPFVLNSRKQSSGIILFSAMGAVAGAVLSISFLDIGFGLERMLSGFERDTVNAVTSNRLGIWETTLELVMPVIWTGTGPDSYMFLPKGMEMGTVQPHGFHMQVLSDWGLIGVLLVAAVAISLLVDLRKATQGRERRFSTLSLAFLWAIAGYVVFSAVDGVLYHSFSSALFFAGTGLFFAAQEPDVPESGEPVSDFPRAAVTGALVCSLLVMTGHALSLGILRGELPGSPENLDARFMRWFPSALTDPGGGYLLDAWVDRWQEVDPALRNEWYDWIERNARSTPRDGESPERGNPASRS